MADLLNTPTLPKLHRGFSRRALMREMLAICVLAAVPDCTVATPLPVPKPSPRICMNAPIEELFAVPSSDELGVQAA